jgi:hypothetical protein
VGQKKFGELCNGSRALHRQLVYKISRNQWSSTFEHENLPILATHALHTGTNTNINHAHLDRIGNIDDGLQPRTALSVQALDGSIGRETRSQRRGTELRRTTARGEHVSDRNVFNQARIDSGA